MDEKFRARLGLCYQLSGRYVMDDPETVLVHGSIQGFGNPRIGHAWVELPGGRVYDAVLDQEFSQVEHVAIFHPVVDRRYSHDETLVTMARTHNWGPWTLSEVREAVAVHEQIMERKQRRKQRRKANPAWAVIWLPKRERVYVEADTQMAALLIGEKAPPPGAERIVDIVPWEGAAPLRKGDYWITIVDETGALITREKVSAISTNAAVAVGVDMVRKAGGWASSINVQTPKHIQLTRSTKPAPRRSRRRNPPGFIVELRDMQGNRIGGVRAPVGNVTEAKKHGKQVLASRGLKIRFVGQEYVDRDGDTIIPATVLPKEAPPAKREPFRYW